MIASRARHPLGMTIAILVLSLIPAMIAMPMESSRVQDDSKWIEVEAEGRGTTAKEARKAAMLAALRKIAGEFLVQNTVMENDQITDDELLTFTTQKAFESEDLEGFPTIEGDGTIYAKMKIRVIARDFKQMIDRFRPTTVTGKQTVEAEGIGKSAVEAERNAIANGVRQIVGEHIESEIVINDERVVKDLIKSYTTSKNVTSERLGDFRLIGDEVAVTMRVTAELEPLYAMFRERSTSATVIDGDVLAAELDLARDNIVAQRKILRNLLKELPTRLLVARLINREGQPIENGRPSPDDMKPIVDGDGDEIAIAINIECYFDLETFYTKVAPALARALDVMAEDRKPMRIETEESSSYLTLFTMESAVRRYEQRPWTYDSSTPPDKCQVILARGRNKGGTHVDADLYILPEDLFTAFSNVTHRPFGGSNGYRQIFLVVSVDLLDQDGKKIRSLEWNPAYLWQESDDNPIGRDLPIFAEQRNAYPCFNMYWRNDGVETVMINPSFAGHTIFDTSVWRHELRMTGPEFERLDRIELSAQLYETSDSGYPRKERYDGTREREQWRLVNPDLNPIGLGWKDAKGNAIEPGGAFERSTRPNRTRPPQWWDGHGTGGSSAESGRDRPSTINEDALASNENRIRAQKEAQREAELKQFDGLVYKLGNYAMNGICDKARSTADELLSMDQELMSEDKLWLGITKTGRCPKAQKELLEKLIELYPDRPRTKTAKRMLETL